MTDIHQSAPNNLVVFSNTVLDVSTGLQFDPTPELFITFALPFEYDPCATAPQWEEFLESLWPEDSESIALLQELFGYWITSDTCYHIIALIVGPPRAGKGVIQRIAEALLGADNVAFPMLSSFAQNFGVQSLIGKSLAVVPDARISSKSDLAAVAERLLSISGGDRIQIDRKHKEPVQVKLNTRIVMFTNEVPRLPDSSSALASRFLVLQLKRSFLGKEDLHLVDKLMTELPGILNWSLEGLQRLRRGGGFVQPASGNEARNALRNLGSDVSAFADECLEFGDGFESQVSALYAAYDRWSYQNGFKHNMTCPVFSRKLSDRFPELGRKRGAGNGRHTVFCGVRLVEEDSVGKYPRKPLVVDLTRQSGA